MAKYNIIADEDTLKLNEVTQPKIWMVDSNSVTQRIIIRNVQNPFDYFIPENPHISEISVNNKEYDSVEKLSEVLTPLLYSNTSSDSGSDPGSGSGNSGVSYNEFQNFEINAKRTIDPDTYHSLSVVALVGKVQVQLGNNPPVLYPEGYTFNMKADKLIKTKIVITPESPDSRVFLFTNN